MSGWWSVGVNGNPTSYLFRWENQEGRMIQVERQGDSVRLWNEDSYSLIVRRDKGGKWKVAKTYTPTSARSIMFTPETLGEFGNARDAVFFAKHCLGEGDPDELGNALRDAGLLETGGESGDR